MKAKELEISCPMTVREQETLVRRACRSPRAACMRILADAEGIANDPTPHGGGYEFLWNDVADMFAVLAPGGRLGPKERGPAAYWKLETAVRDWLIGAILEAGYAEGK